MATKSKTSTADTKAIVTPVNSKAAAVDATTETKTTVQKSVETKVAGPKAVTKTAEPAEKKTAAKKPATKEVTTTTKKTIKKADVAVTATYILQFGGKEVVASNILETVKKVWVEKFQGKLEEIKTIEIYIKPEENRAYFVINGLSNGGYFVEL